MKTKKYYSRFEHYLKINLEKVESFREIKNWVKNKKTADLGCGLGHLTDYWQAIGIDNDPLAIKTAKTLFPKTTFIQADVSQKLPLADNSLEAIICYNLLEHLPGSSREKLFREIKRVLKKDGIIIAGYADETFWFNRLLAFLLPGYGIADPTHLVSWTPRDFENELAKYFKIIKVKHTSQYGRLIFITRFLKGETLLLARKK